MNEALVSGLIDGNEEALAIFGECDNCVVVDWRDEAEEIISAVMLFLPQDYFQIENRGDTEWVIKAGGRPKHIIEYSQHTKQEEFFVALNQVLSPDFELWQFTPVNGDGYSLFLAPCAWWKFFKAKHPSVLAKYFLSANRLSAYMGKSYFARLFSKP